MVSTRQMATSGSSAGGAGNNNNNNNSSSNANNNTMNDESSGSATARLSVVTRQTTTTSMPSSSSSSICLLPELTTPMMAAAAASNSAATTNYAQQCGSSSSSTSETIPRHNHHHQQHHQHQNQQQSSLTQALNKTASSAAADNACDMDYSSALARPTAGCSTTYSTSAVKFLDLPIEIHSHIFSFMEFKRIGQMRVISKKMNEVCMHILNSTFSKLITKTYNRFHAIKAMMPRRESARRNHPLACECDIIETCYMRLSLLQMTFGKHIERGHCCFFPGAILDEVYTIFNYIQKTPRLERPYRVTDELFDLSTMAMEYFRDRIEPTLPGIANILYKDYFQVPTNTKRPPLVVTSDLSDSSSSLPSPPQSNMVLRKGIRKIKQGMKIYNNQLSVLRNELSTCKRKSTEQGKQIAEQQKLLAEQQKQALEYANRLDENDRKNEEMSRKFSTLLQELNKCKTELQYWRSKSPAIPICTSCGQKIAPVLPAEDYQALINQGVKPEDIILNMNDDTDAECDISTLSASAECNSTLNQNEFVFPDETTTAKLMAVNTAAKNLKRHHQQDQATAVDIHQQQQQATTSNNNHFNNRNSSLNVNTSMETTKPAAETTSLATTITSEATNQGNATLSAGGGDAADVAATVCAKDLKCAGGQNLITPQPIQSTSYSTKLFYGTQQQQHRSVIVTPNSIAAAASQASTSAAAAAAAATATSKAETQAASAAALNGTASDMCSSNNSNSNNNINNNSFNHNTPTTTATTTIDATSLQTIAAHETKKARRVQKATRCLATSGGKRSK